MTTAPSRKASTVLGWFPSTPATEREVLDIASARDIALRARLRIHYWLTECQPFTTATVDKIRRKMVLLDAQDAMSDEQVREVLTEHYGFAPVPGLGASAAWRIPDLDDARAAAVASIQASRERGRVAGLKSAEKRAAEKARSGGQQPGPVPAAPVTDDSDF